MANISSLIPLDGFVRRLLAIEDKDNDDYMRYMQIACEGLREFAIHDFDFEVTKVVTVDSDTNSFAYPSDYVKYSSIATPIDGRWWRYTLDQQMVPLKDDDGVDILDSLPNVAEFREPTDYSRGGGHNRYYFRPDEKNRRFQVGGFTPDIVVLKYVSNGIDADGDINIPDYAVRALQAFVRWNIAEYDNPALSRIDWLKARYNEERRNMRSVQRASLQDLIDAINASSGQTPRRG
jgi:hypothetical protein